MDLNRRIYAWRLYFLLTMFSSFCLLPVGAARSAQGAVDTAPNSPRSTDFEEALSAWRTYYGAEVWPYCKWVSRFPDGSSSIELARKATFRNWRDSNHVLLGAETVVRGSSYEAIGITNPNYVAKIVRRDGEAFGWRIEAFAEQGTSAFKRIQLENNGMNKFMAPLYLGPFTIFDILADEENYRLLSSKAIVQDGEQSDQFTLHIADGLVINGIDVHLKQLKIVFSRYNCPVPRLVVASFDAPEGEAFDKHLEFGGWSEHRDRYYWKDYKWTNRIKGNSVAPIMVEASTLDSLEFSDDDASTSALQEQCWLSYYGLPEPAGSSSPNGSPSGFISMPVLLNVLAIAGVVLAIYAKAKMGRRRRNNPASRQDDAANTA